jgi:hypothetical protein
VVLGKKIEEHTKRAGTLDGTKDGGIWRKSDEMSQIEGISTRQQK